MSGARSSSPAAGSLRLCSSCRDAPGGVFVTSSGPDAVRIEIAADGHVIGVEGSPDVAEHNAWCVLDSVRLAHSKAGRPVPFRILAALALLRPLGAQR